MTKSFTLSAIAAIAALALAGCGTATGPTGGQSEPASGSGSQSAQSAQSAASGSGTVKACMVSAVDEADSTGQALSESAHQGLNRAGEEMGVSVSFTQSSSEAEHSGVIDTMIHDGCTLVIGVGDKLATPMTEAAQKHLEIQFALADSTFQDSEHTPVELTNGRPLLFNPAEAAFLAGYVAAGTTSTGKVATYGGAEIPAVQAYMDGFARGVEKYNEDNSTAIQVLGWNSEKKTGSFIGDFSSADKATTLTQEFISQSVDIIMPVAGSVGTATVSAINAAPNKDELKVIWSGNDGHETVSDPAIFTSVVKEIGNAVYDTVKDAKDGRFSSSPYVGTLKNAGVALAPFYDMDSHVSQELKARLDELASQIKGGQLQVSTQYDPAQQR